MLFFNNNKVRAFSISNPYFLAGKAGAASALALLIVGLLDIPDMVTASFVAILCCSPGALMGVRTSLEQFTGSVVGGAFGTLAVMFSLPQVVGVPLAVALAILSIHSIGFTQARVAASFTALFVQIVTFGAPMHTFGVRLSAVGVAAFSAFLVNVVVSAFFYESLFKKREKKVGRRLEALLIHASEHGPGPMYSLFAVYAQLESEISQAMRELEWRNNKSTVASIDKIAERVRWQRHLVHLVVDLDSMTKDQGAERQIFLAWLAKPLGNAPLFEGAGRGSQDKLVAHLASRPQS